MLFFFFFFKSEYHFSRHLQVTLSMPKNVSHPEDVSKCDRRETMQHFEGGLLHQISAEATVSGVSGEIRQETKQKT